MSMLYQFKSMGTSPSRRKLNKHLQQVINKMRSQVTAIGTSVVIGVGKRILLKHKKPTVELGKEWAKSVLQ